MSTLTQFRLFQLAVANSVTFIPREAAGRAEEVAAIHEIWSTPGARIGHLSPFDVTVIPTQEGPVITLHSLQSTNFPVILNEIKDGSEVLEDKRCRKGATSSATPAACSA